MSLAVKIMSVIVASTIFVSSSFNTRDYNAEDYIRMYCKGTSVDEEIAVAISQWETGHWNSEVFEQYNNFGGMQIGGQYMKFATVAEGAEAYVDMLDKYYFSEGLDSLEEIQPKYCPPGEQQWIEGINSLIKENTK